jgi:hypothetical protein
MEGRAGSGRAAHGKEDPHSLLLCDRPYGRTRGLSLRQLSTAHDYATLTREYQTDQPSKKHLDRYPLYPQKAKLMKRNSNTNPRINIQRD